ncbi:MAG: DUF1269 domain-containing protein [Ketobacter sp.]|nr:MAG: DUF1269 domain-containing protein [Ketobacter sp.]
MTTRIFFLVPDEMAAEKITEDLHRAGIKDPAIHAVARRDKYPLADEIPEAGVLESSDVAHAAKRGALTGGAVGLFAGLGAVVVYPLGLIAAGGAIAALSVAGVAVGSWSSSLVGVSVTNSDFAAEFEDALDAGQILMLVDVEEQNVNTVKTTVNRAHPDLVLHSGTLNGSESNTSERHAETDLTTRESQNA